MMRAGCDEAVRRIDADLVEKLGCSRIEPVAFGVTAVMRRDEGRVGIAMGTCWRFTGAPVHSMNVSDMPNLLVIHRHVAVLDMAATASKDAVGKHMQNGD